MEGEVGRVGKWGFDVVVEILGDERDIVDMCYGGWRKRGLGGLGQISRMGRRRRGKENRWIGSTVE
ncbi:hypothetical protein, partial [Paenibacillus xylanexedens]|uniref:hypothetical protein n=1 Tax=Paenibacillus xylanexedens TaxID=528191 RepID=UPI001C930140